MEVIEYMSHGWREFVTGSTSLGTAGRLPILPGRPWRNPLGDWAPGTQPDGAPAGSDREWLRRQALVESGVERAVLALGDGRMAAAMPNHYLARELAQAINSWTADRWLTPDDDLYGLVLAPTQLPDDAAAEVRRAGTDARMVGVLLSANGLAKPFGHPVYHAIYAAAADLGLPVVIHAGGDAAPDTLAAPTAAGFPSTYTAFNVLSAQSVSTHLVSLIGQGVFEKFPILKVAIAGAGSAWLPALTWRFDLNYKALRRELPWVRRLPSEYLREHVRVITHPLGRAGGDGPGRLLAALPEAADILMFGSGYPDWDCDRPAEAARRLPLAWRDRVLRENAKAFFRWPGAPRRRPLPPNPAVGRMEPQAQLR